MPRRLLVVEQRYSIRQRGLILAPGVAPIEGERFRPGDRVLLVRPDGSTRDASIRGTSMVSRPGAATEVDLMLDLASKDEVPIGTEVWSVDG